MDIITLSLAKKYANKVAAGFSNVEVQGNNLIFTLNDGTKATMTIPTPEKGSDGISIVDVSIDTDGSLLCHMSDGSTVNAGKVPAVEQDIGNVSSDVINSIVVVDALPEIEEEGILYLVKEPSIEYVVNPTMEMGDISRDGSLSNSAEYCRTADYVYVYGKNNITITNGLGVISRVLCYDADKNFMTNWNVSSEGSYSYRHVQDGHDLDIPEGCYYIKIRFSSTEVKPITIGYNN